MRLLLLVPALAVLMGSVADPSASATGDWVPTTETGIVLPLQDYVGDETVASAVESYLGLHLANSFTMVSPEPLRDELRRLRIRAPVRADSARLKDLADQLGVSWFAAAAIHEAVTEPTPRLTVSLRVFRAGSPELDWAALESATDQDGVPWLGIRKVGGMVHHIDEVTHSLVSSLSELGTSSSPTPKFGKAKNGFLREATTLSTGGLVAVVPLSSSATKRTTLSVALATVSLEATLIEFGFSVLHPSTVAKALRQQGKYQLGEIDPMVRVNLSEGHDVAWMMTGTVEGFEQRPSSRDGPWVAVSARLVEAETGTIVWMGMQDRQGVDNLSVFEQGIVFSSGRLTQEISRSLIASFTQIRSSNR